MSPNACPFCQRDNYCTANSDQCWCQTAHIPSALIALLPSSTINKACICRVCIEAYQQDENAFKETLSGKTQ